MAGKKLRPPTVNISPQEYKKLSAKYSPKPRVVKNVIMAFLIGGLICSIAQVIINFYILYGGLPTLSAQTAGTGTMIFLGALLTGLGVYDEIGRVAGAGSIVPVTGFANSMVSLALEYKGEGYVFGVGGKLFTIAGPVFVFGISTSIIAGIIYYLLR